MRVVSQATNWVEFHHEKIGGFLAKELKKEVLPFFLDLIDGSALLREKKSFEITIHHKCCKPHLPDMRGQWSIDPWPTGNQKYLMPFKGLADFQAPEEMTDPQDMLAVVDNSHRIRIISPMGWLGLKGVTPYS